MKKIKTSSEIVKDEKGNFIEDKACIEIMGKKFCSGGSYLLTRKDNGKKQGIFYAYPRKDGTGLEVGTWDGSQKVRAIRGDSWCSNMGDERQSVWFTWDGVKLYGVWFKTNSDIIRAREIKR